MRKIKRIVVILIILLFPAILQNFLNKSPLIPNFNHLTNHRESMNMLTWEDNGTVVCNASNTQAFSRICSDGIGGAIIAWMDFRNGNYDMYVQRIFANGSIAWTTNGVAICTAIDHQEWGQICSDGAGGAIIAWQDGRGGSDWDIYAQKILTDGNVAWTANGIPICTAINDQTALQIVSDGSGGAIITWTDSRSGADIYAQKVFTNGTVAWTVGGTPISTASNNQNSPQICGDGSGGAIITWGDTRDFTNDVYAQKIFANGSVAWINNGVVISNASYQQSTPQICSDGAGGAIITWRDSRFGINFEVYAQKIFANGTTAWLANGSEICTSVYDQDYPEICSDGAGGAIITWRDNRSGITWDIYAQKIFTNGSIAWSPNGIPICTAIDRQELPQICSDGAGGAIITWRDNRNSNYDIYAQKVFANKSTAWTINGITLCNASDSQDGPEICCDGMGGAIISWMDFRNGLDHDIYAQLIDESIPVILGIEQIPISPDNIDSVNITAHITDNVGLSLITIISNHTGIPTDYSMDLLSGSAQDSYWNYTIPSVIAGTTVTYSIWANDTSNNQIIDGPYQYTVGDGENPNIISISREPINPNNTNIVNVSVHITDNVGVSTVLLNSNYTGTSLDYVMEFLSGTAQDSYWNYTIPFVVAGTTVTYSIWANDTSNNQIIDGPYQYTVGDGENPNIISISREPINPNNTNIVNVSVHITDNVGVSTVLLNSNYTGTSLDYVMEFLSGTAQDSYWNYTIPPIALGTTVTYSIWANDTSNNPDTAGPYQYLVSDNENPDIVSTTRVPLNPGNLNTVNITAHITDNIGTDVVIISSNHTGSPTNYSMNFLSGTIQDGYWNFTIPAIAVGTTVEYSIWANDTSNNSDTAGPYQYLVSDNENPNIIGMSRVPLNPGNLNTTIISVHITDNVGVDVVLITSNHSGIILNYPMLFYSGTPQDGFWNFTIPTVTARTTVEYSIWTNDTSNNPDTAGPYQYLVSDNENPDIVSTTRVPLNPGNLNTVNITAYITDNIGIDVVIITLNHTSSPANYSMDFLSGTIQDGYWNFTIPTVVAGTTVQYSIWVNDTSNNFDTAGPYQYLVSDNENPKILIVSRDPIRPGSQDIVNITIHITDNIGIHTVLLVSDHNGTFNTFEMTLLSGINQDGYWNITIPQLPSGTTVNYSIWINDTNDNNVSSIYYQYTVRVPSKADFWPLTFLLTQMGSGGSMFVLFFTIIGAIAAVAVISAFILLKRSSK